MVVCPSRSEHSGGANSYRRSVYGGSHTTWYTNSAAQAQYRTYIKAVVSRYITSTAVFAWELANEPRCSGCSTDVIYKWAADTSAYIKSLDSNHMVTLGDEGFNPSAGDGSYPYQTSEGTPPVELILQPSDDTNHDYGLKVSLLSRTLVFQLSISEPTTCIHLHGAFLRPPSQQVGFNLTRLLALLPRNLAFSRNMGRPTRT